MKIILRLSICIEVSLVIQNIKKINRFKFLVEKYNYIKSLEYISKVLLKYLKKKKFVRKIRKLYDNKIIVGLQSQTIFKNQKPALQTTICGPPR